MSSQAADGAHAARLANVDPNDPWRGVDPMDPAVRENPHPYLAHLREVDPVNLTPLGFWRLTRYADVERLLKDVPVGVRRSDGTRIGEARLPGGPSEFMLQQDPPDHTRLRRLVSKAFTPNAVTRLRAHVREIVTRQLDRVAADGRMDVIADLALPVPATVICEMMGVPLSDRDRFTEWTADATHLLAALFAPPEVLERGAAAAAALRDYFEALIEERRKRLGDDLLSDLIRAEEEGDRLSPTELISQSIGLLIAGFETTIGLIGNGVLALIRHPDQLALLRSDPSLVPNAVEECLRYDGPILLTVRYLREDTRFGDKRIPKDAMVMAFLAAAHRDPAVFPDPDRFDVTRQGAPNLAFGGGVHYCLGAHLARMEAQEAIGGLVTRFRDLELESERLEWGRSLFRVLGSLPIRFAA
ncbi:MAG TPA: cytochrome P450 [Candidatus Binatia bacterium]